MKRTIAGIVPIVWLLLCLAIPAGLALAQPVGQITSPRDRAQVRGQVPIEGSAAHDQFQKYELHYGPEPNPGDSWTPIGGSPFGVPVIQGRLGLWDTTLIPDGVYSLRLRVVRLDGNYDEYFVRGVQVSNTFPTDTPTPEAAVTPTPSRATDTPAPTPTVLIAVPTVSSPTPRPTSTPLPTSSPTDTPEPSDMPFTSVSGAACWGAGATLAAFVAIGLLFGLKGGIVSLVRGLVRRGRESMGVYED
ncbi:MAG: hypothetical protein PHY79_14380 [Anaerolineae bacterium]|nr:hypothetical protein [Anaerolineae bacterium]MDX9832637.1 hypothetical protein [Anaerolineae bacterium]